MEELDVILNLLGEVQGDETLDLTGHSVAFADIFDAGERLKASIAEMTEALEANAATISELKGANWDLSQRITKRDEEPEPEQDQAPEQEPEDEEVDESIDETIEKLFEDGEKEEDK